MSPTSSSNPFAGRKTRSAALRTNFSSSLHSRPAEGARLWHGLLRAQTGTVALTCANGPGSRRPRAVLAPGFGSPARPPGVNPSEARERTRGAVVGRGGDLDRGPARASRRPTPPAARPPAGRRPAHGRTAPASSRSRRVCAATPACAASRGPGTGVWTGPSRPGRGTRRGRAGPGWRAMKRRTLFSVGSSSAPISTPSVGSSRKAAANGPASPGPQPAQRDPVALEVLRNRQAGHRGDGTLRL